MTWTRDKLEQVTKRRLAERAYLKPVEKAALAYARWQGLTDEVGIDRSAAKQALDAALDNLEQLGPENWAGLEKLAGELGDPAIIGLMQHSLRRSAEQARGLAADHRAVENSDTTPVPANRQTRKRGPGQTL